MTANRRNFWILLTTFAVSFGAAQWLGQFRPHNHHNYNSCYTQQEKHPCNPHKKKRKKRKKRKPCSPAPNCSSAKYKYDVIHWEEKMCPNINDFIFADHEPRPLNMAMVKNRIQYPQIAQDAGIQGTVVLRVLVDRNGTYCKHKVINKVHPILSSVCEENIRSLRFSPAIQNGKCIPFWVNVPFEFDLNK